MSVESEPGPNPRFVFSNQRGVALAILVWFLAAMSILVGGIVMEARVDIKLAQLHKEMAQAESAGDGAIQLALADLLLRQAEGRLSGRGEVYQEYMLGDLRVLVVTVPISGLIDLNSATEDLLALLFAKDKRLSKEGARDLAVSVLKWRASDSSLKQQGPDSDSRLQDSELRHGRFEAVEDLLLVPGVDRQLFEVIRDSIYVAQNGQAGVDWLSAPASVLRVLGDFDQQAVVEIVLSRLREQEVDLPAPDGLDMRFQQVGGLSVYRVDALVIFDGMVYRRRRWVNRGGAGSGGLPWRFFRTEAVTVLSQDELDWLTALRG